MIREMPFTCTSSLLVIFSFGRVKMSNTARFIKHLRPLSTNLSTKIKKHINITLTTNVKKSSKSANKVKKKKNVQKGLGDFMK